MNEKKVEFNLTIWGVLFVLLAVLLGAFGAHGLKKWVDANAIASFDTGVRYQMYHGLALILLANMGLITMRTKKTVALFFGIGTLLFSLSIYFLVIDDIFSISLTKIAWITPLGGLLLITGWVYLLIVLYRNGKTMQE